MALTQVKTLGIAADAVTGAKVADDQIDSEHYAADSIDTEHYAANSVDLDAMAGIARGKLIVGNASGDPAYLAAGTDNYVLTMDSNGDCGWEAAAAGGASLSNDGNNRVVTGDGSGGINGEANLIFDGTHLGVGTASAAVVSGGPGLVVHGSTAPRIRLTNDTTGESGTDGSELSIDGTTKDFWIENREDAEVRFATNGAERFVLENDGDVTIKDGDLVIGTSGHGIDFSAHTSLGGVTDQVLYDYEEGRWDIVGNTNLVIDTNYNSWSYTKIGRLVTIRGKLRVSSISGTDNVTLSLPFTNMNMGEHGNSGASSVMYTGVGITDRHVLSVVTFGNYSTMLFYGSAYNVGWTRLTNSHLNAGDEMYLSHTYFAT